MSLALKIIPFFLQLLTADFRVEVTFLGLSGMPKHRKRVQTSANQRKRVYYAVFMGQWPCLTL